MTDEAPADRLPLTDQEAEVYRLYVVARWSQQKIADHIGVTQPRISYILSSARAKMPPIDLVAMRQESISLHHHIQREAIALAEMNGAPVTAGKDGDVIYDPEGNGVVRDFAGRVAALKLALEADRELRKLMGADAATKTEVSGSVRYEIVGVDVEQLK